MSDHEKEHENLEADVAAEKHLPANPGERFNIFSALPGGIRITTSYDLRDDEQAKKAFLAKEKESKPLAQMLNKPFLCEHVLAHEANTVNKDTGEIINLVRIVFVGPNGELYSTVSEGIRACVGVLCIDRGGPPWNPPIKMMVVQSGRMLRLVEVKD